MKCIVTTILASAAATAAISGAAAHEAGSGPASASHLFLMHPFDHLHPVALIGLVAAAALGAWAAWRRSR